MPHYNTSLSKKKEVLEWVDWIVNGKFFSTSWRNLFYGLPYHVKNALLNPYDMKIKDFSINIEHVEDPNQQPILSGQPYEFYSDSPDVVTYKEVVLIRNDQDVGISLSGRDFSVHRRERHHISKTVKLKLNKILCSHGTEAFSLDRMLYFHWNTSIRLVKQNNIIRIYYKKCETYTFNPLTDLNVTISGIGNETLFSVKMQPVISMKDIHLMDSHPYIIVERLRNESKFVLFLFNIIENVPYIMEQPLKTFLKDFMTKERLDSVIKHLIHHDLLQSFKGYYKVKYRRSFMSIQMNDFFQNKQDLKRTCVEFVFHTTITSLLYRNYKDFVPFLRDIKESKKYKSLMTKYPKLNKHIQTNGIKPVSVKDVWMKKCSIRDFDRNCRFSNRRLIR